MAKSLRVGQAMYATDNRPESQPVACVVMHANVVDKWNDNDKHTYVLKWTDGTEETIKGPYTNHPLNQFPNALGVRHLRNDEMARLEELRAEAYAGRTPEEAAMAQPPMTPELIRQTIDALIRAQWEAGVRDQQTARKNVAGQILADEDLAREMITAMQEGHCFWEEDSSTPADLGALFGEQSDIQGIITSAPALTILRDWAHGHPGNLLVAKLADLAGHNGVGLVIFELFELAHAVEKDGPEKGLAKFLHHKSVGEADMGVFEGEDTGDEAP